MFASAKTIMPDPSQALPGRDRVMPVPDRHLVLGRPLLPPFPASCQSMLVGMGCFWGGTAPVVLARRVGDGGGLCRRFHPQPHL